LQKEVAQRTSAYALVFCPTRVADAAASATARVALGLTAAWVRAVEVAVRFWLLDTPCTVGEVKQQNGMC
jgi:hypothetical protein